MRATSRGRIHHRFWFTPTNRFDRSRERACSHPALVPHSTDRTGDGKDNPQWGNEPLIGDGFRDMGVALIIGVAFHTKATGYMPQTSGGTNGNERPSRSGIAPRPARGNRLAAGHSPLDKQARRIPALLAVPQIFFQTHCQAWQTYSLAHGWDERWPGKPYAVFSPFPSGLASSRRNKLNVYWCQKLLSQSSLCFSLAACFAFLADANLWPPVISFSWRFCGLSSTRQTLVFVPTPRKKLRARWRLRLHHSRV